MLAEHPSITTKRFINSWRSSDVDTNRLAEEILSVTNETHRQADNFHLIVRDGELIDPATNKVISFTRNSPLKIAEGKVWDALKIWANANEEGSAVWTSPRLEGVYPCDKVIYYQIAYTFEFPPKKVLLSTAILLDNPNFEFSENLRETLIVKENNYTLVELLEELGQTNVNKAKTLSQEEINYFVDQIKSNVDPQLIVDEMQKRGVIGKNSISCPTRSAEALMGRSKILNFTKKEDWEWKPGHCRVCDKDKQKVGPCSVCWDCQENFDKIDNSQL